MLEDNLINTRQRQYLKGLAHQIKPVVQVGKGGIDEGVIKSTEEALEARELIKVKVLESSPEDRDQVAEVLKQATNSSIIGQVGRVIILFRKKTQGSRIELP